MLPKNLLEDVNDRRAKIQKSILFWAEGHYRNFPWRRNRTPYSVLVSEVLLKRTTASSVNRMYDGFMLKFPSLQILAQADISILQTALCKLGYHIVRAKIFHEISTYIIAKYQSRIPNKIDELLAIPHVGEYTGNAVLTFGYGIPAAIVDTNVERILRRIFLHNAPKGTSLKPFQEIAELIMPAQNNQLFNYGLLDLGGTVCISSSPKCPCCPINEICDYSCRRNNNS